jgi:hypothetical protein
MFFQKSAEFGVLRWQVSLCVVHTAMVILTMRPYNYCPAVGFPPQPRRDHAG